MASPDVIDLDEVVQNLQLNTSKEKVLFDLSVQRLRGHCEESFRNPTNISYEDHFTKNVELGIKKKSFKN